MTNQIIERLEKKRLLEIQREYKKKGYRVVLEPRGAELPQILSGFQPDMIAYGSEENVVVEVKSKFTLAGDEHLTSLASAVEASPGWRLDLVVTNPEYPLVADKNAEEPGQAEIMARLGAVSQLLNMNQPEAALLLAWSASEATLRWLAEQENIELETNQPAYIIKSLYSSGVLGRDEYDTFQEGLRLRNVITHGFRSPGLKREFIISLVNKVEQFLGVNIK